MTHERGKRKVNETEWEQHTGGIALLLLIVQEKK